ncbi:MAG TPA: colanic acid biosynthesis glycosyltransferase WcaL [Bacteroidetes bacterium]|nr:colanic acid biosynthesis glycosyltransferase WcaL [Bacteroidota bacterium]
MKTNPFNIGHSHPVWLPNTMTWLYRQISELNSHCDNYIYCEKTENLDVFPIDRLRCFSEYPTKTKIRDRIIKRIGLSNGLNALVYAMEFDKINLLHSHFGHVGVTGASIAKKLGVPHVVSFYGMDIHKIPKKYPHFAMKYEQMFADTDRVFCEGPFMAKSIIKLGADPDQMCVHPLGIELNKIEFSPREWHPGKALKVLIAASFRPKKGIPLALEALLAVSKHTNLEISIVGDAGYDSDSLREKGRIFDFVTQHEMQNMITFMGFQPHEELFNLAKEHHLFIHPSLHAADGDSEGGIPVTLIEMAATGLPVVSSTHCDIPSLIQDQETGWIAKENDLNDLISTIERAIADVAKWPLITKNSRKHIESNYDALKQSKKLFEEYERILNAK